MKNKVIYNFEPSLPERVEPGSLEVVEPSILKIVEQNPDLMSLKFTKNRFNRAPALVLKHWIQF